MNLLCPECKQRINIPSTEEGNMVHCPKCDHKFLCEKPSAKSRKSFARTSGKVVAKLAKDKSDVVHSALMDSGIVQILCLVTSLLLAMGCIWLFYMSSGKNSSTNFLSMLLFPQQQMFAIFFACLSGGLLACAGRRHKVLFVVLGVILAGFIGALPYVYTVKISPIVYGLEEDPTQVPQNKPADAEAGFVKHEPIPFAEKEVRIHSYTEDELKPLFSTIEEKEAQGVLGIWTVGVNVTNCDMIKRYLKRMTQSEDEPMFYDRRGMGGGLFVITPTAMRFEEFVEVAEKMGKVTLKDADRYFVEVELNREKFDARPGSPALRDERHAYFALSNYKELSCLDSYRIMAAAKRLAAVKNIEGNQSYANVQEDMVRELKRLLQEPWGRDAEYVTALTSALVTWAKKDDKEACRVVFYVVSELKKADCEIPVTVIRYLLDGGEVGASEILLTEWVNNPQRWEKQCCIPGSIPEEAIIRELEASSDYVRKRSAVRILGQIGGKSALEALKKYKNHSDNELRLCAELAIDLVEKRLLKSAE